MGRENTIISINGVTPACARKIAKYAFRSYYFKLVENTLDHTYDIFLKQKIDEKEVSKDKIKDFREFWGGQWKVYIYKLEAKQ